MIVRKCKTSTCLNNGTCVEYMGSYSCQCIPGFDGRQCEVDVNECQSKPCQNGGTCQNLVGSYGCTCPPGLTGQSCQTIINQCLSKPCQNGGSCINSINAFRCNCDKTGYTGRVCENKGIFSYIKSKMYYYYIMLNYVNIQIIS